MAAVKEFPGPKSAKALEQMKKYVVCDPWPFVIDPKRCDRLELATIDNQKVLDWGGLYGSLLLSYNHPCTNTPEIRERLADQSVKRFPNPDFLTLDCLAYYEMLYDHAPIGMRNPKLEVYVINSGAEAVENMMKYMIHLHCEKLAKAGKTVGEQKFLYFDASYHGRTVFTLNITHLKQDQVSMDEYHGLATQNLRVPFPAVDNDAPDEVNDAKTDEAIKIIEAIIAKQPDDIVGVIIEPMQGAGGNRVVQKRFMQELSRVCHEKEIYLGFDEVQTSGGCCGAMFAVDLFDLPYPPSAVAVAKKWGCGAVFLLETFGDLGLLDSTWGGSLPDMVRVVAEVEYIDKHNLIASVESKTAHLIGCIKKLQAEFPGMISNIRGLGLYQGWTMPADAKKLLSETMMQEQHTFLLSAGPTTIRLRPPIDVTEEEINVLETKLRAGLQSVVKQLAASA